MNTTTYFDFSFQKKLDNIVKSNWHECFQDDSDIKFKSGLYSGDKDDIKTIKKGELNFFDPIYGIFGCCSGSIGSDTRDESLLPINLKPRKIKKNIFWLKRKDPNHHTFLRIIFYIHENWHNTVKLVDKKINQVITLISQKIQENLSEINSLRETIMTQQQKLEKLENQIKSQQKVISQVSTLISFNMEYPIQKESDKTNSI